MMTEPERFRARYEPPTYVTSPLGATALVGLGAGIAMGLFGLALGVSAALFLAWVLVIVCGFLAWFERRASRGRR